MDKEQKSVVVRVAAWFSIVRSSVAVSESSTVRSALKALWHWIKD